MADYFFENSRRADATRAATSAPSALGTVLQLAAALSRIVGDEGGCFLPKQLDSSDAALRAAARLEMIVQQGCSL